MLDLYDKNKISVYESEKKELKVYASFAVVA